jgi:D-glycerate 3-kinase
MNDDHPEPRSVALPIFNKSLFAGAGDRSDQTVTVNGPIDVFICEGWSMGFQPIRDIQLCELYECTTASETNHTVLRTHSLASLKQLNTNLREFGAAVYPYFDCQIVIKPSSYQHVYRWRLQQELHMKSENGGIGMSDEEVERFVDRYMPAYELYGSGAPREESAGLKSKPSLILEYGIDREVLKVEDV